MDIWEAWDIMKRTLDYGKAAAVFREQAAKASFRDAAIVYIIAAVYSAFLAVVMNVMSLFVVRSVYYFMGIDVPEIELDTPLLAPYALYFFGLIMPLGLVITALMQAVTFKALRLTGGKGNFVKQLYLYSFLALALSVGSTLMLSQFFSCLGLIPLLGYLFFSFYVQFYLQSVMLRDLHSISTLHAFMGVLIGTAVGVAAYLLVTSTLAGAGISAPLPEDMLGIAERVGELNAV
ncbi:MAG: hypothetical protein ABII71_06085 [Candidatus Micrarchaeota archaeon]